MKRMLVLLLLAVPAAAQIETHCSTVGIYTDCTTGAPPRTMADEAVDGMRRGAQRGREMREERERREKELNEGVRWCLPHPGEVSPSGMKCSSQEYRDAELKKFGDNHPNLPATKHNATLLVQYLFDKGFDFNALSLETAYKKLSKKHAFDEGTDSDSDSSAPTSSLTIDPLTGSDVK